MHIADEENYERGYEWWLMKEAKARNPAIKLYGLSWGFPGWVAEGGSSPLTNSTVTYITKWLVAARDIHGLTIDYIGVWNENAYSRDYILGLHASLRAHNLSTLIVAADDCCPPWNVCDDLLKDNEWARAVARIGGSVSDNHTLTCSLHCLRALCRSPLPTNVLLTHGCVVHVYVGTIPTRSLRTAVQHSTYPSGRVKTSRPTSKPAPAGVDCSAATMSTEISHLL